MKKIILFLSCLILPLCIMGGPVSKHGKLSVQGITLTDRHGTPVVLRGVSFGWHNWWPRFYNEEVVSWLASDWNCSVVRAATGVGPQGAYQDRMEWSENLITTVVDAAIRADIYVIIDWHSHEIRTEEATLFFSRMAERYKDYPNVIYEIFNEPVRQSWEEVKAYSEEIIKAIRAIDPDNMILVGSPHWDTDIHIAAENPIHMDTNIMYTLHFYANGHRQELRERADSVLKKGIPLFISECAGMEPSGNGPVDITEWNTWITWMEKNKLSWVAWSVADKNETCSMLTKDASSSGNWKEKDLKEWGRTVIGELKIKN